MTKNDVTHWIKNMVTYIERRVRSKCLGTRRCNGEEKRWDWNGEWQFIKAFERQKNDAILYSNLKAGYRWVFTRYTNHWHTLPNLLLWEIPNPRCPRPGDPEPGSDLNQPNQPSGPRPGPVMTKVVRFCLKHLWELSGVLHRTNLIQIFWWTNKRNSLAPASWSQLERRSP